MENPGARLFSNPAGDYGSMVNERVGASNWTDAAELGDTWASRNAYSYGRGAERGAARGDVLQSLLRTTQRVVQQIDSVEYGLTDIQEYYANTGALLAAAQAAKKDGVGAGGVGCSVVEAFGEEGQVKELDEVLRLEYRSKLLNPKWAEAMAAQARFLSFFLTLPPFLNTTPCKPCNGPSSRALWHRVTICASGSSFIMCLWNVMCAAGRTACEHRGRACRAAAARTRSASA